MKHGKSTDIDELVEKVKLEEKKELSAENNNENEVQKIIEKKESNICKVCLKDNHLCTCVCAEKKHAEHHNKLSQGLLGEKKQEQKELLPGDIEYLNDDKSVKDLDSEEKKNSKDSDQE